MKNSCSTLLGHLALTTALLCRDGLRDPHARPITVGDLPNMLMRQAEPPGDGSTDPPHTGTLLKLDLYGRKIHGGNQLSKTGHYAEPRMQVNQKPRLRVSAEARPEIAGALKAARKSLNFTQSDLAQALGSSQDAVSRWERAIDSPPVSAFQVLADIVPDELRPYWIGLSGAKAQVAINTQLDIRNVTVLRDAAAAGTPRAIDENEVDYRLYFPPHLLPRGGKLFGVKVVGDSMSPILEPGYIAVIDVSRREASKLVDRMVAAREGDGITLKWLRKDNDLYLLVPQNTSQRHPIRIMKHDGEWSIVGEVVKWIGEPPVTKRK